MPILWDELPHDAFEALGEAKARRYCQECRRRTLFDRDVDGYPICRECASDEEKSDE